MIGEHSKWNKAIFDDVILPEATIGHCRNSRQCKQFNVELANGYCVKCWDRGLDTAAAEKEGLALKRAYSPVPNNGAVKKSRRHSVQVGGSTYMSG
jgi:hypothetical protein